MLILSSSSNLRASCNGLLLRRSINPRRQTGKLDIRCRVVCNIKLVSKDKGMGESRVERSRSLNLVQIFLSKSDAQGLYIGFEMFDLALTNDGEYVGGLVHDIGQGDTVEGSVVLFSDLLEGV